MMNVTERLRRATPVEQLQEVTRGATDLYQGAELLERLQRSYDTGIPLRIKAGFDPTAPDLHLGHTVVLSRMRRFQQFGHTVIFLIGDFTGMIGDPTGRSATRRPLSREEIQANAETYKSQVFKVLDPEATQIKFNSEWLGTLCFDGVIHLAAKYTIARMLERDDFKKRYAQHQPIGVHEFLYPLAQAYDSVALRCDVELGGSDQLFNLLVGRAIMPDYGLPAQVVLTNPLLEGLDARLDRETGKIVGNKMSKSLGNYIGIVEPPEEQFGKMMSMSDELMWRYFDLLSDRSVAEIDRLRLGHPREAKALLAKEIVGRYHGPGAAEQAEEHFNKLHVAHGVPDKVDVFSVALGDRGSLPVSALLADSGICSSKSEARRMIEQGAVTVEGSRVSDPLQGLGLGEHLVKVGKRRFVRIRIT